MDNHNVFVAIMAGGVGSRFWPASKATYPKQFLDILGTGKSLIRSTFERSLQITSSKNIVVVTNTMYKDLVKEHLPELDDNQILCEPSRNNTAPCIAYTSFKLQNLTADARIVVVPSDHIILKEAVFVEKIREALSFVEEKEAICTLGISPTRPDTGYGYINFKNDGSAVNRVIQFTEKPNLETAQKFVDSGDYLWNAGIFIFKAATMLQEIQKTTPEINALLGSEPGVYNTKKEQAFIDLQYPKTPNISIDYAVMEKSEQIFTIPADIGWSDLGTWGSLYAEAPSKDEVQNAVFTDKSILVDCTSNLIRSDRLIVAKGLENFIVVNEGDTLLIWPKDKEQEIKAITKEVEIKFGKDYV